MLTLVADEERGRRLGAQWLVEQNPHLFQGCTEAIGEAGGFSYEYAPHRQAYLVQTGEKAIRWVKVTAQGRTGHASMPTADNAVISLAEALVRVARHHFFVSIDPATAPIADAVRAWTGQDNLESALYAMGSVGRRLLHRCHAATWARPPVHQDGELFFTGRRAAPGFCG